MNFNQDEQLHVQIPMRSLFNPENVHHRFLTLAFYNVTYQKACIHQEASYFLFIITYLLIYVIVLYFCMDSRHDENTYAQVYFNCCYCLKYKYIENIIGMLCVCVSNWTWSSCPKTPKKTYHLIWDGGSIIFLCFLFENAIQNGI